MDLETLIDEITEAIMIDRGYDRNEHRDRYEWDANNEDSQYSLVREDAEFIVDLLQERGLLGTISD
jgi:hypothetical protein